jgi:hypothetical protein
MTRGKTTRSAAVLLALATAVAPAARGQGPAPVPEPAPVKLQTVYPLPFFCIQAGLQITRLSGPVSASAGQVGWRPPAPTCSLGGAVTGIYVPPANADDVAKQLKPQIPLATAGTATASVSAGAATAGSATASATGSPAQKPNEFELTATADKRAEIVFCRAGACTSPDLSTLQAVIYVLAKPKFAYFKDYPIHSEKTGKKLLKVIPVINSNLKGEVIATTILRVESDKALNDADLDVFEKKLAKYQSAVEANEIFQTAIPDDIKKDLKGAAPDVEVASIDMPYFCQNNDLKTAPTSFDPDKDTCNAPSRVVQAGNIDAVIQAVNNALKGTPAFTLSKDGFRILLSCGAKCDPDALTLAQDTITSVARPVPLFVAELTFPRGTTGIAASEMNRGFARARELTETLVQVWSDTPIADGELAVQLERIRERGFGSYQIQPLQRMFYQDAGSVVGDLLSTPPAGTPATLGGDASTSPVTSVSPSGGGAPPAAAPAATPATTSTPASGGTTVSITNNPAPAAATPATPAAPARGAAPTGNVGLGMTAVDDNVVFTDTSSTGAVKQRSRLLTMLDMPRPEVLMNMWSFQASSSNGTEVAQQLSQVRDLVSANNDALQHAIDYGWGYLSRQMGNPEFFDQTFYKYITRQFVADTVECEAHEPAATNCLTDEQRSRWGLCDAGKYCLGYEDAFDPAQPSLTNILLGMIAAKSTTRTVLTTIGCMEGKFEVYGSQCFPDRNDLKPAVNPVLSDEESRKCIQNARAKFLEDHGAGEARGGEVVAVTDSEKYHTLSCELLDRAAIYAEGACGLPVTLPLSCFTLEAARTFMPDNSFSTFPLQRLNSLAELNLADAVEALPQQRRKYTSTGLSLLRSAVADFLFNYKIAIQFPNEMNYYSLPHSAQQLNSQFNPLVVAFNQDVAALSRTLLDEAQHDVEHLNQNSFFQLWRHNKSYIANGLITVRGISGVESLVDTDTQNAFDSTQAQTLGAILNTITGAGASTPASTPSGNTFNVTADGIVTGGGSAGAGGSTPPPGGLTCSNGAAAGTPLCAVAGLLKGSTTATGIATALSAITPTQTHSIIGRQLTLDVIPHTLPGASSAELDIRLWAQEDSAPTIYSETGSTDNDYTSRVARHNVATRVRVDSVKLFDVSTFTAMVQRPRTKLPIVPPFVEIPLVSSLLSVPLPAAKIYHASSAIVSAIIVPTAADLGYGIVFKDDLGVFREDKKFSRLQYSLRVLTQHSQYPETAPIFEYHSAMVKCLAMGGGSSYATLSGGGCDEFKFTDLPPTRP